MGINEWVGASISLYKVILTILHHRWTCYLMKWQIFNKSKTLFFSYIVIILHVVFLIDIIPHVAYFCNACGVMVKYKLSEGLGRGHGVQIIQLWNIQVKNCWRLVLFYFSIVFRKAFLFLQKWFKQFDGMNQLVIIDIHPRSLAFHIHILVINVSGMQ